MHCSIRVRAGRIRYVALVIVGLALVSVPSAEGAEVPSLAQPPKLAQQVSLAAGAAAERNGDYMAAEVQYRTLAASPNPTTATAANLALGRLLERLNRATEAVAPLQAAAVTLGATPDGLRATFLLGEAQADLKQSEAAVASFRAYLAGNGPAQGYASLEIAWTLQAAGDDAGALAALAAPLQAGSVTVRRAALQAAAQSLAQLDRPTEAAADLQAFVDTLPPATDRANALLELGRLYHLAGDDASAATALLNLVQNYPSRAAAGTALGRLDDLAVAVDPLQRGIVLFDLNRNDEAQTTLQAILDAGPAADVAAQATYYLARLADREDRNDEALAGYAAAYNLDPAGPVASDSIWLRALLLRFLGRYDDAAGAYTSLVQQFPASDHVAEASFAAGLMAYLAGRPPDAATAWTVIARTATGAAAARADLWLGKLALERGDAPAAAVSLNAAQTLQPSGYYGLRAELVAKGASVALPGAPIALPTSDWNAIEAWLTNWAGPEDPAQFQAVQATQDWTEGLELDALGWVVTPNMLLGSALDSIARQPWALYRAARALAGRGRTNLALSAAGAVLQLTGVRPGDPLTAPTALLRLAYPVDYVDLVNQDGLQNGIDPLLIEAVARQESAFDPAAGSIAGAQGLLQLVPSTAADVATALGLTDFTAADLTRPRINLQLGSTFLARQAKARGGDLSQALGAYNAGGGNASRWAQQSGNDPDRFYETVDFTETRSYLRLVSENYAIYNALYRGAAHPTLLVPSGH